MKFTLTINCDNAAFHYESEQSGADYFQEAELADILRKAASKVENGDTSGTLRDSNGNTVGSFELTDGITEDDSRY